MPDTHLRSVILGDPLEPGVPLDQRERDGYEGDPDHDVANFETHGHLGNGARLEAVTDLL